MTTENEIYTVTTSKGMYIVMEVDGWGLFLRVVINNEPVWHITTQRSFDMVNESDNEKLEALYQSSERAHLAAIMNAPRQPSTSVH